MENQRRSSEEFLFMPTRGACSKETDPRIHASTSQFFVRFHHAPSQYFGRFHDILFHVKSFFVNTNPYLLQGPEQCTKHNSDASIEQEDNAQQLHGEAHNNSNLHYAVLADVCNMQ